MDGNNVELNKREMRDEAEEKAYQERLRAAKELEGIATRLAAAHPKSRLLSIVLTKIEEAALWYSKLLKEED